MVSDGTTLFDKEDRLLYGKPREYKEYVVSLNGRMSRDSFIDTFKRIENVLEKSTTNSCAFKELESIIKEVVYQKDDAEIFLVFSGFRNGQGYLFSTSNLPFEETHKLRLTEDTRFLIMSRSDAYKKHVGMFQKMLSENQLERFDDIRKTQENFNARLTGLDSTINNKLTSIVVMNTIIK